MKIKIPKPNRVRDFELAQRAVKLDAKTIRMLEEEGLTIQQFKTRYGIR